MGKKALPRCVVNLGRQMTVPEPSIKSPPTPHNKRKQTLYSTYQMMELFKNASSSGDVSQEQLAKIMAESLPPKGTIGLCWLKPPPMQKGRCQVQTYQTSGGKETQE
jgi:hypothetical protein